ncbi:hypothetical protein Tco_1417668 [Tanacetum coccineum]
MSLRSSPNHHTFDIEDAFSSNFLDYTSTSLDYFPVSPGNISLDPSDNLSKYLLASLAISPSYDDPYMQAYIAAANEPPISPQAPSDPPPVLSPISSITTIANDLDQRLVLAFPKELINRVLGLQVMFLELDRFGILLGEQEVGQGVSCTLSKVSCVSFVYSILFVLSRGGSMRPDTFLPFIMLLVVIIFTVVVAVVVVVGGGIPSITKLLFMIIGSLNRTMI